MMTETKTVALTSQMKADEQARVLTRFLKAEEDTIRAAAARALCGYATDKTADELLAALLDEDEDVRIDAMVALRDVARPQDARTVLKSLQGDPIPEVKIAAVKTLARLKAEEAFPLLCRLVVDRAEDEVFWDEHGDVWDDWLDIQLEAVRALGRYGNPDAVEPLMKAWQDEMGQEIHADIFMSLAALPERGLPVLLDIVKGEDGRSRRIAMNALMTVAPEALAGDVLALSADDNPEIRRIALRGFPADHEELRFILEHDTQASVRAELVRLFGAERQDLSRLALLDESEEVRARALKTLVLPDHENFCNDLLANLEVWISVGGETLCVAAVERFAEWGGSRAVPVLCALVKNADRPEQARLKALSLLGTMDGEEALATLELSLKDRSRQMRVSALSGLRLALQSNQPLKRDGAVKLFAMAIGGDLLTVASDSGDNHSDPLPGKTDKYLEIAEDGEILHRDKSEVPEEELAAPQSTLAALQRPLVRAVPESSTYQEREDETRSQDKADDIHGGEAGVRKPKAGGKKRVDVRGPEAFELDLRINALNVLDPESSGFETIRNAMIAAALSDQIPLQVAALNAMARVGGTFAGSAQERDELVGLLKHPESQVRYAAAAFILKAFENCGDILATLSTDNDAHLRSLGLLARLESVQDNPLDIVRDALSDEVHLVRRTVLERVAAKGDPDLLKRCVELAVEQRNVDALLVLLQVSSTVRDHVVERLDHITENLGDGGTLLEALGLEAMRHYDRYEAA
ncbi:HEAT repeat domain-containing protein [Kiloniella sp. b19]|uniref:HEAT repeat domain-containing protein n=1 Tax=Kiloniella sp. GXU_MW_B19 TaxID=3141326 RepID=UPI0031D6D587